jgi:hypothetical protein
VYPCNKMKLTRFATLSAVIAGSVLAGCSDLYYDRRETVAAGAADAVASNAAVQTVDPWPPYVGNQNVAMDGARAAIAVDRYRTGRVIVPVGSGTSSAGYQQQQQQQPAAAPVSSGTQVK